MKKEVVFQPSRWIVHISVTSPENGEAVLVARHSCRDRHHAATLLSEIRELAEDLAEFLPGLTATGYEVAEAVAAEPARDAYWCSTGYSEGARAIGQIE